MAAGLMIVWHSRTGAARAMAQAARNGAAGDGTGFGATCRLLPAEQAMPEDLLTAAGYLFCCPENLGGMTGAMKEFFDRSYYPLLGRIEGRPYATIIAAGSDGSGAGRQIDRIVTGWRLRRVADPLTVNLNAQTPAEIAAPKTVSRDSLQSCHDLGQAISAGLELGVF